MEEIVNNTPEQSTPAEHEEDITNISSDDTTDESISESNTVFGLNKKIEALTQELEAYKTAKQQQEKIAEQLNEFSELFPNIAIKAIPDEVWENVKMGNTLVASYAVYEKRISEAARRIEEINKKNSTLSAGALGKNLSNEYLSIDEVRKMSPAEVRSNFAKIRRSMETWN